MPATKPPNTALLLERFMQRTALGVFLLALRYGMTAAGPLLGEELMALVRYLQLALSLLIVLLVLPAFWHYLKLRRQRRADCANPDSFVLEMFRRAALIAFSYSFVLLVLLDLVSRKSLVYLSAPLVINLVLSFMLAVFSISFYLLSRLDEPDDDEPNDEEPQA